MPRAELPENGVRIRMYRQGHGDCFLLTMPPKDPTDRPVSVLIDCGFKPGSAALLNPQPDFSDIIADIEEATDNQIDLLIVTHEHQDHVNGFWKELNPYFAGLEVMEAWFAWTEDPADPLATMSWLN